jgi:hypothetical protein
MKIKKLLIIIFVSIFSFSSFAGTIDPSTPDEKYVEYGSKFDYVAKLNCFDGKNMYGGSAVVIDKHWILTAAHVIEDSHSWTIIVKDKKYNLKKVIKYPEYKTEIYGYHDIALGYCEEEIILGSYPELYKDTNEVGRLCSIAGLGFTGTFHSGASKHDGKKRAGSNYIDKIERGVLVCSPSRKDQNFTQLEFLICSGDSGGGLVLGKALRWVSTADRPRETVGRRELTCRGW